MMRSIASVLLVSVAVAVAYPALRGLAAPAAAKAPAAKDKAPPAEVAKPRFVVKAEKGFIDDPFALDPEAGSLAVLFTDAASFARIDLIDLTTGKPRKTVELGTPGRLFERLVLVPGGKGVVLISQDTASTKRSAQYFDAAGAPAGALGPFDDFGLARRGGEDVLVALQKSSSAEGDTVYTVAAHRLAGLAPAGKPLAHTVGKNHALKQPALDDVEWQDGYGQLAGVRHAEGDAAKAPVRVVVLDTLGGTVAWEGETADRVAFSAVRELRRKTPGRSSFLMFSPDTHVLELFDFLGRHAPVTLPVPLASYDATTLVEQQDFGAGSSLFSLGLDKPAKPAGRAFDLYRVEGAAAKPGAAAGREPLRPTVTRVLRAPADDRPVAWAVRGAHAAVLRKLKDFSRGGAQLEIYALAK
jgi:hypothetical protein